MAATSPTAIHKPRKAVGYTAMLSSSMQPCRRCQRPVVFQTPQCPHCGLWFVSTDGHDAVMRGLLPVGRTGLSIVAGYLGIAAVFLLPAPLALAIGIWAIADLKKQPDKHGMGRAIFGVVMGGLGTLLLLALVVAGSL
jgi:hypothetical protein